MEEHRTARELLHDKLVHGSVFFRSAERQAQEGYLDDVIEEYLQQHLDEAAAQGLALLDSMQRVGEGTGGDDGWNW